MTLKLQDLHEFVKELENEGYTKISDTILRRKIAMKFGLTPYIQNNIMRYLGEFGLITSIETGVWLLEKSIEVVNDD